MFDPNLPQAGTEIDAVQMRSQLNGLKTLIDAVPGLTDVMIDSVTTLPPGSAATVTASVIGTVLHLTFGIPQGDTGAQGEQGEQGDVNLTQLDNAIATTSSNTNAVGTLDTAFADPDDEIIRAKINELVLTLRR